MLIFDADIEKLQTNPDLEEGYCKALLCRIRFRKVLLSVCTVIFYVNDMEHYLPCEAISYGYETCRDVFFLAFTLVVHLVGRHQVAMLSLKVRTIFLGTSFYRVIIAR